jgi:hypothetical protein
MTYARPCRDNLHAGDIWEDRFGEYVDTPGFDCPPEFEVIYNAAKLGTAFFTQRKQDAGNDSTGVSGVAETKQC